MDIAELLKQLEALGVSPGEAAGLLRQSGVDDLGFSVVDYSRCTRQILPEVVFAQGKTFSQVVRIMHSLFNRTGLAIASRVGEETAAELIKEFPGGVWDKLHRVFHIGRYSGSFTSSGAVAIVTAGTSDLPVAGEAGIILDLMGVEVRQFPDIGVAGIHRLGNVLPEILKCSVCICCAGMDGALVSVLGGLFPGPVIAVPVSTGYGASLSGFTALFSALSSCSPGVSVVNIDNGLGAAASALRILSLDSRSGSDAF